MELTIGKIEMFFIVCNFNASRLKPPVKSMLSIRGAACLKLNVHNCGIVVEAFMHKILKRDHLQIA